MCVFGEYYRVKKHITKHAPGYQTVEMNIISTGIFIKIPNGKYFRVYDQKISNFNAFYRVIDELY